ncbi:hypothetical protein ABGB14_23640 [Nonomuraea sp. B10E15]|uniref:hypothetical protein n=1 Tax=Nonomuraea sp. B10E15 TaxID=3153560 RepID=UPI00325DB795
MESSARAKSDGDKGSIGALFFVVVLVALVVGGFGWIVHRNSQWEQMQRREAEGRVQKTAAEVFREFSALPASASKGNFHEVLAGRGVDLTAYSARTDRTDVVIRVHAYADTQHGRLAHLRKCFAYTLMFSDAAKSSYRSVACGPGWSVWDLAM